MRRVHLVILASMTALGCGGKDSAGPGTAAGDTVRFSYSGNATGSVLAVGTGACSDYSVARTYACGFLQVGDHWVLGAQAVNDSIADTVWLLLNNVTGPTSLPFGCQANCAFGSFLVRVNVPRNCCSLGGGTLDSGTVLITSFANGRMKGTFSGASTTPGGPPDFVVTNGYFNVAVGP